MIIQAGPPARQNAAYRPAWGCQIFVRPEEWLMAWQWTLYAILALVSALTLVITAFYILLYHKNPASKTGALVLFTCAELMVAYLFDILSIDLTTKIFWMKAQYVGLVIAPTAWLIYSIQYTGREKWLTSRNLILLGILPLLFLLLVFTNQTHRLIWDQLHLVMRGSISEVEKTFGVGFWMMVIYLYLIILISGFLHIEMFIRSRRLYRWQASLLIIATIFPYLGATLDIFNLSPLPRLVSTTAGIMIACLMVAFTIYRVRWGDIRTVSHKAIFDRMGDAVIVLDAQNAIIDLNESAQKLIGHSSKESFGKHVKQVFPSEFNLLPEVIEINKEVVLHHESQQRTYDMRISPLTDWRGNLVSRVMVLRDITEHKKYLQETSALLDISTAVSSSLNIQEVLLIMAERLLKLTHFNMCEIYEWDEKNNQLFLLIEHGHSFWLENQGQKFPLDQYPTTKRVLISDEPEIIHSSMNDPDAVSLRNEGYSSSIILPLRDNDQVTGVMEVSHTVEIGGDHSALVSDCQKFISEASPWLQSLDDLPSEDNFKQLERFVNHIGASDCSISRWDRADNSIEFVLSYSNATWGRHQGPKYNPDEWDSAFRALREGKLSIVRSDDPDISPVDQDDLNVWKSQVLVVIPISVKNKNIGIVELYKIADDGPVSEDVLKLWKTAADQAGVALENARLFDEIQRALTTQITIREASNVIVSALDTNTILNQLANQICIAASATSVYICEYNETKTLSKVIAEYISPEAAPEEKTSDINQEYTNFDDDEFLDNMTKGIHDYSHIDDSELSEEEIAHMQQYAGLSLISQMKKQIEKRVDPKNRSWLQNAK
jgi:PAS domain S-box-containing protein